MKKILNIAVLIGVIAISVIAIGQFQQVSLGANASAQSDNNSTQTRTLSVTGTSSAYVTPDKLSISFAVETQSTTAQAAIQANAENMTNVIQALKQVGLNDSEIGTSQYSLYPVYDYVNDSGKCIQYDNGDSVQKYCPPPTMKQILVGYKAVNGVIVSTSQLNKAGQLIDSAVSAGANRIDYLYFTISDQKQNEVRNELISQAVQDAQSKANVALGPVGMTIVNVLNINVDSYPVYPQRGYQYSGAASGGAPTPTNPGVQQVSASVHTTFEIGGYTGRQIADTVVTSQTGENFHLTLDSNPSTGYQWRIQSIDNSIVKLVNDQCISPSSGLVGASGKQVLTFQALKEGRTTIVLEYVRPWEPQSPANTYTVVLTVHS